MDWAALGRGLGYAGALGVIGAAPAAGLLRASGAAMPGAERAVRRVAVVAALLLLVAAAARLVGQATAFLDPDEPLTFAILRDITTGTSWGHRWLWQVGAAVLAGIVALAERPGPRRPWTAAAGVFVALTLPLTGHAQEFPLGAAVGVVVQGLHVAAAGVWLGTLGVLTAAIVGSLRQWPAGERLGALYDVATRFSRFALVGAGVVVLAGVVLAVANLRSFGALTSTAYGQLILLKVALLLGVMGLGAWNWRRAVPALATPAGDLTAARHLARSAAAEIALAVAVLAATAVLSATDAPGLGHEQAAAASPRQSLGFVTPSALRTWPRASARQPGDLGTPALPSGRRLSAPGS